MEFILQLKRSLGTKDWRTNDPGSKDKYMLIHSGLSALLKKTLSGQTLGLQVLITSLQTIPQLLKNFLYSR